VKRRKNKQPNIPFWARHPWKARLLFAAVLLLLIAPVFAFLPCSPIVVAHWITFLVGGLCFGLIQYPSAGAIFYTQFSPSSVQAICDALNGALVNCGWTSTSVSSTALITFTGVPTNTQIIIIGPTTYTFVTTITATANQVHIGVSAAACATSLFEAINAGSGSGTDYSSTTVANTNCTATNPSSGLVRVTSIGTGFTANSQLTVNNGLSFVAITETTSTNAQGRGYVLTMPATPQGLQASVWIDDDGHTTFNRIRLGTVDGTLMSASNALVGGNAGTWTIGVSVGATLEFSGCAHQFCVFKLADKSTGNTKFFCGVPYIRPSNAPIAITAASNANPIQITAPGHGLITGQDVFISDVVGNTAANGFATVTVIDANNLTIPSTGNGAYVSGGLLAGPTQIARCMWAMGDSNNNELTWRTTLNSLGATPAGMFICVNQYSYSTRNPITFNHLRQSNPNQPVYNWGMLASFQEPRLIVQPTSTAGIYMDIGQLWASFLVLEPQPMDRQNAGFDTHNWFQICDNDTSGIGSLWFAKS
jgi:hypothetical protein